ncbi:Hypothetical predicted protein [Olea europaea subsp. europaea]|uniref:Uncharacterized protein n=1 Tax=Olea europaea subsp. europaea TaxID=158383 RepID=A0A8S0U3N3_OLEEU|nr:Hypothetical predicted protein [Olea europaea subsp. europaea]
MNNEEEQDRADNDGNDDNGDGIFVDCNDFDVSEDSPRRVDDEVNSPVADDNNFELRTHEPCSRDIVNGNDVESTQIVSESEDFGNEGCLLVIDGGEQIGNMNNEEEQDRADNDGNDDNGDGIFVDCNDFDVSEDSPRRVDDEVNSPVADDNNFELRTHEPCSRDIVNGNDVESTQIVSESGGRPSKKRKTSAGETRVAHKCSRYKKIGHVRSTCTGQAASSEH